MFWPCETRTSTCLSFATISSGLYRFLAIAVLLDVKDIPQVGPLQWGGINRVNKMNSSISGKQRRIEGEEAKMKVSPNSWTLIDDWHCPRIHAERRYGNIPASLVLYRERVQCRKSQGSRVYSCSHSISKS